MVTRLAFTADSQVDDRSRFEEHARVMNFIVRDAEARGCETLLHGGDVFERRSTERERAAVAEWINDAGIVYIVAGNHEAVGEVEELQHSCGALAFESPRVEWYEGFGAIAFLPWPRRASLRSWLRARDGKDPSIEETDQTAREMLRDVLRGFARSFRTIPVDVPRILLGHVEVEGFTSDSDQPAIGGGIPLSVEDLMLAEADIVLLGHIHKPQSWVGRRADGVEVPVIYAGSPRRTSYARGELKEKGYVVVEFDGRKPTWTRVPTPATPMHLVEVAYEVRESPAGGTSGMFVGDAFPDEVTGAEIRFRYTVAADRRVEAAHAAAEMRNRALARGAREVKVEESVLASTRARSPEIAAAVTMQEKLSVFLRGLGVEPDREARLLALAGEIEQEVGR